MLGARLPRYNSLRLQLQPQGMSNAAYNGDVSSVIQVRVARLGTMHLLVPQARCIAHNTCKSDHVCFCFSFAFTCRLSRDCMVQMAFHQA